MTRLFSYSLILILPTASLIAGPKQSSKKQLPLSACTTSQNEPAKVIHQRATSISDPRSLKERSPAGSLPHEDSQPDNPKIVPMDALHLPPATTEIMEISSLSPSPHNVPSMEAPEEKTAPSLSSNLDGTPINIPSTFTEQEKKRDALLANYQEQQQRLQESTNRHQHAIKAILDQNQPTLMSRFMAPFEKWNQLLFSSHTCTMPAAHQALAAAADQMATDYTELHRLTIQLGYQAPQEVNNHTSYSEETLTFGDEHYPKEGFFSLGKSVRDQLKALHEHNLLLSLQSPQSAQSKETLFSEIKRDLNRATFILKWPLSSDGSAQAPCEELLYNHHDEAAAKEELRAQAEKAGKQVDENTLNNMAIRVLQDQGINKLKAFINGDPALEFAIGSLMYQRGLFDLECMKYGVSRNSKQDLAPYFTAGLQSIRPLQDMSQNCFGKTPKIEMLYFLEKSTAPHDKDQFQLTISHKTTADRFHTVTKQAFTLHTLDTLTYTFTKNRAFNPHEKLSETNLPVAITCIGGKILHTLAPFEELPPASLHTLALAKKNPLTPEQEHNVHLYLAAENAYLTAKQSWASRLNSLAAKPHLDSLISLEKQETEQYLKKLRQSLQEAALLVANDPSTDGFLERNVLKTEGTSSVVLSWTEVPQNLTLPEKLSFIGSKELKKAITEQIQSTLLTPAPKQQSRDLLIATAKALTFQAEQRPRTYETASDDEALHSFLTFMENDAMAEAISLLIQTPTLSITPQLEQEPLFGDALIHLTEASECHFYLEKTASPSSDDPLFFLTADYHLEQPSSADRLFEGFSRSLDIQFVYALQKNPLWNPGELDSSTNPPIQATCTAVKVHQTVELGF